MRPHRRQPTRLLHPWDSPGKNTGVGCHFLLQCMKVKSENEFTQSCPTPSHPMDCSLPGSSVHEICQARDVCKNFLSPVSRIFTILFSSVQSLSRVQLFATPWTAAYQAPPSMGFSRQEYWSVVPLPSLIRYDCYLLILPPTSPPHLPRSSQSTELIACVKQQLPTHCLF